MIQAVDLLHNCLVTSKCLHFYICVYVCVMVVMHTNYNHVDTMKPLKCNIAAFHCCSLHLDSRLLFSLKSSVLCVLLFLFDFLPSHSLLQEATHLDLLPLHRVILVLQFFCKISEDNKPSNFERI